MACAVPSRVPGNPEPQTPAGMSLSDTTVMIVGLLRDIRDREEQIRVWREMLAVAMALVSDRDADLGRQRRHIDALKSELRRHTAAQVGGPS